MIRPVMKFQVSPTKKRPREIPNDLRFDFAFRSVNPEPELDRFEREENQSLSFNRFMQQKRY